MICFVIFKFYTFFLCNVGFFLVKIGFLVYLKFCKSPKEIKLIIITFRKIKFVNLELTSRAFFSYTIIMCC
jgi:hypothetical protein